MDHPKVRHMPVEFGLKFMPVIRSDNLYPERELFNDIVDKIYGTGLSMGIVDLQGSNASAVINSGILVAPYFLSVSILKNQELHVYLNMMAWYLFFVTFEPFPGALLDVFWKPVQFISQQDTVDAIS
jgi:hypothetical protein